MNLESHLLLASPSDSHVALYPSSHGPGVFGRGRGVLGTKLCGIPYEERITVDHKVASIRFLRSNGASCHHFRELSDLVEKQAWCEWHGQRCEVTDAHVCDILVTGPPCTPYSSQRSTRGETRWWASSSCMCCTHL